ncbi:hypothetical protein VNI00_007638 [Paramarasmius palmivorus]|uniref:G protein-coupled receptor n=1 Tax=Paramarasmius palmivorus TaxID=297713 RepID=A0AAW0D631_9AGAR
MLYQDSYAHDIDEALGWTFYMYMVFLICTVATNLLLTVLIAGRIIYISREATKYVGKNPRNMYRTAIAVTLESGLIYPVLLIIYIASSRLNSGGESTNLSPYYFISIVAYSALNQAAGIAPTLVIVRTSLGIAIEDTKSCISTFRAEQHDDSDSQADIPQSQSTGAILDISRSNGPGY